MKNAAFKNYNVVLIAIDTLRADRLGCYGHKRPQHPVSPAIDNLAKNGILFEKCFSQAPVTAPSFMSVMTSYYPSSHGVMENFSRFGRHGRIFTLNEKAPTLAQILKNGRYRTAAFTDGGNLYGGIGFAKGFDYYSENSGLGGFMRGEGPVPMNELLYWFRENRSESFFLFLHTFAVHSPWLAPKNYQKIFAKEDILNIFPASLENSQDAVSKIWFEGYQKIIQSLDTEEKVEHLKDLYDGAIAYADDAINKILRFLEELRINDRTIIIFTSDHGEEFLDHGMLSHRQFYNELLRVPLIISIPGFPGGTTVRQIVRSIDIFPTILELLGLDVPNPIHGASLLPALKEDLELSALAETLSGIAFQDRKYKYIFHAAKPGVSRLKKDTKFGVDELYDLKSDPDEKKNIAPQNPDVVRNLLDRFMREQRRTQENGPKPKITYFFRRLPGGGSVNDVSQDNE